MSGIKKKTTPFKRIIAKRITAWHFLGDCLALISCHILFWKKYQLLHQDIFSPIFDIPFKYLNTVAGITAITILVWLLAFYISGHYSNPARKSGLQIIGPTAATCFTMSVLLFFILDSYAPLKRSITPIILSLRYFFLIFIFIFSFRMIIIKRLYYLIKRGKAGYKKVIVGNNQQAFEILKNAKNKALLKHEYIGYLAEDEDADFNMTKLIPCLGNISNIKKLVTKEDVDEAIVCLSHANHKTINLVINDLKQKDILIRLSTNNDQMLEGAIKTQNLESSPFITITNHKMPVWQDLTKKMLDFTLATISLILASPLFMGIAIAIRRNSKGPIFYKQERIGKNQKPFIIYKFRSMFIDAEKNGPALSSPHDPRITKVGKFIRKWRLDELPQLINVIKGNMSFVGPRPERQFYIDQILPQAPHYEHLFTIKPGITSWGLIKYGYAKNIDEMIERLKYDILYLENRTLVVDFKILLYTLKTIFNGEGM